MGCFDVNAGSWAWVRGRGHGCRKLVGRNGVKLRWTGGAENGESWVCSSLRKLVDATEEAEAEIHTHPGVRNTALRQCHSVDDAIGCLQS